jgi:hypothetical protein
MTLADQFRKWFKAPQVDAVDISRWLAVNDPPGFGKVLEGNSVQLNFSDGSTVIVNEEGKLS